MNANRLRTGIFLIGIGIILLGNTLGYLEWFVWGDLLKLWPVLLIAIGIEMIFKRTQLSFLSYLSPLLIAGSFLYIIYGGGAIADKEVSLDINKTSIIVSNEEASGLDSLRIDMDLSLGDFEIKSTAESFFKGEIENYGDEPRFKFTREGKLGMINLKSPEEKRKLKFRHTRGCHSEILITDKVPVNLIIDAGVVDLALDLSDIHISRLDMDSGVSDLMIRFGEKSEHIEANFDIGVSDLSIYIPEGTAVRLHRDTGLASVSHRELGLVKVGKDRYESPDYAQAKRTIDVEIEAGVSDIEIEYYKSHQAEL